MAQLACNYSPALMERLAAGRAHVDRIKLSYWPDFAREFAVARPVRPLLLHVLPHAHPRAIDAVPWTWDAFNGALASCGAPQTALHLETYPTDWDGPPGDRAAVEAMVAATRSCAERVAVPLLVENCPYYPHRGTLRCATDPAVVREVCERAGVDLLLDLAHARVAAWQRREDVDAYVRALPLERVREIHVDGPGFDRPREGLRDSHLEMQAEDERLLAWVLDETAPEIVTLEYGGAGPRFARRSDPEAIVRQLDRLADLCARRAPARDG